MTTFERWAGEGKPFAEAAEILLEVIAFGDPLSGETNREFARRLLEAYGLGVAPATEA